MDIIDVSAWPKAGNAPSAWMGCYRPEANPEETIRYAFFAPGPDAFSALAFNIQPLFGEEVMQVLKHILVSATVLALPLSTLAGDGHRGHGHGHDKHHHKHERKHKHKHHDKHHDRHYHEHHVYEERVVVPAVVHPPVIHQPSGVTIHGNVHIPM